MLDHRGEAGPRFLALVDGYESGADRAEQTARALFFIFHLLVEKAETAAFAPLCLLLPDGNASVPVLGDAITWTLRRILISSCDGDPAALQAVVEAQGADTLAREDALLALAYLARTGRVPKAGMHAYLLRLLAEMRPRAQHIVRIECLLAVAYLGYSDLSGQAEDLIKRGSVSRQDWSVADFRSVLKSTLDDPTWMADFVNDELGPFADAIGEVETWASASGQDAPELPEFPDMPEYIVQPPITNPLHGVGRNDPCPCGSGKRFKKCCLLAPGAAA